MRATSSSCPHIQLHFLTLSKKCRVREKALVAERTPELDAIDVRVLLKALQPVHKVRQDAEIVLGPLVWSLSQHGFRSRADLTAGSHMWLECCEEKLKRYSHWNMILKENAQIAPFTSKDRACIEIFPTSTFSCLTAMRCDRLTSFWKRRS